MVEDRRVGAAQRVMNQAIAETAVKAALAQAAELGISMPGSRLKSLLREGDLWYDSACCAPMH